MKRLSRRPGEIETLNFHAAVDAPLPGEQRLVSDPARVEATVALFEAGLRESLETPSRIRGWVSDQLFGLIAADLGGCQLVKQEDSGVLFYDASVKLPDWRLTLSGGESILVEVKAIDDQVPRIAKLRLSEVHKLKRYAELNRCALEVALHWVSLSLWTLAPIDVFARVGDHYETDLVTALKRDLMGSQLEDRMLGLVPPLEFCMTLEETGRGVSGQSSDNNSAEEATQVSAVVTDVRMHCGGREMIDAREKALIWFLIQHARWPVEEELYRAADGVFKIVFTMAPEEEHDGQAFATIGRLSELYTRMFYASISIDEGTTQLSIDVEPGTLPRLVPTDLQSDRLPLWHIRLAPNEP